MINFKRYKKYYFDKAYSTAYDIISVKRRKMANYEFKRLWNVVAYFKVLFQHFP
jgi:hypothetical protein